MFKDLVLEVNQVAGAVCKEISMGIVWLSRLH